MPSIRPSRTSRIRPQASSPIRLGTALDFHPNPHPTRVTLTDGDGTSHFFDLNRHDSANEADWDYDSPAGVHLYLQRNSDDAGLALVIAGLLRGPEDGWGNGSTAAMLEEVGVTDTVGGSVLVGVEVGSSGAIGVSVGAGGGERRLEAPEVLEGRAGAPAGR